MSKEKSIEIIKHNFTDEEKRELATALAQKVTELQGFEDQKKAVMSDLKSQIDGTQAKINNYAAKINNGYEMRNVNCDVSYDFDGKMVYFYIEDTSLMVKERPMYPEELQHKLKLEER